MHLSFRTKLLASHVGLVVVVVLITILALNRSLGADLARQLDQRLEEQAKGAAVWISGDRRHPERIAGRIAPIVNADVAIFDMAGELRRLVGHAAAAAATRRRGSARCRRRCAAEVGARRACSPRGSDEDVHYVAVPAADGLVLRLAAPLSEINATVAAMRSGWCSPRSWRSSRRSRWASSRRGSRRARSSR